MQTMAQTTHGGYLGFDRNDYPGDAAWPSLARRFAFAGYWLNDPARRKLKRLARQAADRPSVGHGLPSARQWAA
jgi:hypothetical protein